MKQKKLWVDVRDRDGNTPLYYAVGYALKNKQYDVIESLIKGGADCRIKNVQGESPQDLGQDNTQIYKLCELTVPIQQTIEAANEVYKNLVKIVQEYLKIDIEGSRFQSPSIQDHETAFASYEYKAKLACEDYPAAQNDKYSEFCKVLGDASFSAAYKAMEDFVPCP
jgi:aminoglycoside N3'-acetyltransferase